MASSKPTRLLEILAMLALGFICLVSLCGILASLLVPTTEKGTSNQVLVPFFLGPVIGGIGGIAMIWLRKRTAWPIAYWAIMLWFVGMSLVGLGTSVPLISPDISVSEKAFVTLFFLIPGGLATLLGVFLYKRYGYRGPKDLEMLAPDSPRAAKLARAAEYRARAAKLARAAEYRDRIAKLVKHRRLPTLGGQGGAMSTTLAQWEERLRELARRLDAFEANPTIQRDLQETPTKIARLSAQLAQETDAQMRTKLQQTLNTCQEQERQLQALVALMRRTDLKIDETLAVMGTLYSQLHLLSAKDIDSAQAGRLRADIDEQVKRLGDTLSAMDDVYRASGHLTSIRVE